MKGEAWQLRLVKKSIKKRMKLSLLDRRLGFQPSRVALDLGCAQGILSYSLRQKGGFWVSTDEDMANLREAQKILKNNLLEMVGGSLPFPDRTFDLVLCLDYLEHVHDDNRVLGEISRVLKEGGELILVTPQTGRFFLLHKLRAALGLELEDFGHKREGYSLPELTEKLRKVSLRVEGRAEYSRFFSELFELIINLVYVKWLAPESARKTRDGHIRPATGEEFEAQEKSFAIYSLLYPFVWLMSRLDGLLFFEKGYTLMVWARRC
jgi:SAM-dependent methyltransferase